MIQPGTCHPLLDPLKQRLDQTVQEERDQQEQIKVLDQEGE